MENLLQQIMPELVKIAIVLLSAIGAWLGYKLRLMLNTSMKREVVEISVKYAEQIGKLMGSEEKFELAKKRALELLAVVGLKITEVELETLIEATVLSFKEHYKPPVDPNEPAGSE